MKIDLKSFSSKDFSVDISHFKQPDPVGAVIVFPGAGYGHMGPCLYYPCNLFLDHNYDIVNFEYDFRRVRLSDDSQTGYANYLDFLLESLSELELPDKKIALSKSIGTRILGSKANTPFIKKIWLTPALKDQFVVDSISRYSNNSLVVIGTSDPVFDLKSIDNLKKSGVICTEIKDAGHGLDVEGNVLNSLDGIKEVVLAIQHFALMSSPDAQQ